MVGILTDSVAESLNFGIKESLNLLLAYLDFCVEQARIVV
jgi:hypothetical protein